MRPRAKKNLNTRIDRCSFLLVEDPAARKGTWRGEKKELRLEIGCGKGSFICEMARRHPDILFVGLECVRNVIVLAMEKAAEAGLENVLFICGNARSLADYFEESSTEDIFDYIPPQKTNQIFTPKWVVKKMVDMLEEENPGCFDQPDKTFADLYMKSGLYIAEIVKRLYQSDVLKQQFPDREARLHHIIAKQVYGLAPTEIIYKIATNFILGFAQDITITDHHFRLLDALEFAKAGTLEEQLDQVFGE